MLENKLAIILDNLKVSVLVISTQKSQLLSCPGEILANAHNGVKAGTLTKDFHVVIEKNYRQFECFINIPSL